MPLVLVTSGLAIAQNDAPKSYTEAMDWYRAGAEAGDPKAQFYLGVALEQGARGRPDLPAARVWFKKAAESGHALARYKLAVMLQNQLGGPADLPEARRLYEQAGEQGIAEARYNLAVMRQDGAGGPIDPDGATELFKRTARAGIDISFLHLAVLNTRGANADLVEAMKWARLAEAAKVDGTAGYIDELSPLLSEDQLAEAEARAKAWK
jgi:TPR repeat protein